MQRRVNNTCPSTSGIRSIGMDGTVQCAVADGALVTNFKSAFQGVTFPAGWKYQANTLGPIGDTGNYVDLVWKTSAGTGQNKYTYKGQSLPAESPGGWVSIGGSNSHSGYPTGVGGATFNIYGWERERRMIENHGSPPRAPFCLRSHHFLHGAAARRLCSDQHDALDRVGCR